MSQYPSLNYTTPYEGEGTKGQLISKANFKVFI